MLNSTQQFSHTHLETPAVVPQYIGIGCATNGMPGHPMNEVVINRLYSEIVRTAATVAAQNATRNSLRMYMWNQISSNGFINEHFMRLAAMTTECVLLKTINFGRNGGSPDQLISAIQSSASECCEIFAAINAVERAPQLLAGVDQRNIMLLYQMGAKLREQIQQLKTRLATMSQNVSGGGVDMSGMFGNGMFGTQSDVTAIARDISQAVNVTGDAIDAMVFTDSSEQSRVFNSSGVSHVTDFTAGEFGIMESLDAIISTKEDTNMTKLAENVISDSLPLPRNSNNDKSSTKLPNIKFMDANGNQLQLISNSESMIKSMVDNFNPTSDCQFIVPMFRPHFQKVGIFFNQNDKSHVLSVYNEGEMNPDLHYEIGQPGLGIKTVVPDFILEGIFKPIEDVPQEENSEVKESVIPDGFNLVFENSYRPTDGLGSAVKIALTDVRAAPGVFAAKQHFTIASPLYFVPQIRERLYAKLRNESGDRVSLSELMKLFSDLVKEIDELQSADGEHNKTRYETTFESLDFLESKLTESVNSALQFNLGIPKKQLSLTSVMTDWDPLLDLLKNEYGTQFHTAMIEHQAEIIQRAVCAIDNQDIDFIMESRFASMEKVNSNIIVNSVPVRITALSVTTEQLDIGVIDGVGLAVSSSDERLKPFLQNVFEDKLGFGGRAFIVTESNDVFEIFEPWLTPKQISTYVVTKIQVSDK